VAGRRVEIGVRLEASSAGYLVAQTATYSFSQSRCADFLVISGLVHMKTLTLNQVCTRERIRQDARTTRRQLRRRAASGILNFAEFRIRVLSGCTGTAHGWSPEGRACISAVPLGMGREELHGALGSRGGAERIAVSGPQANWIAPVRPPRVFHTDECYS